MSCRRRHLLKRETQLEKKPGGVAGAKREGAASRSGCFQGANLSISSHSVGGRGRNPCPVVVAAAVTTAAWSLCLKGVASLLSPSCQLFNWLGRISAAEPGPSLSLSSPGSLPVSLGKKSELLLETYSLGSTPAVCPLKLWNDPFLCVSCAIYLTDPGELPSTGALC